MVQESGFKYRLYSVAVHLLALIAGLVCLLPFLHVLALSLSSGIAVARGEVGIWPVEFTIGRYQAILSDRNFVDAFALSVLRVVIGTGSMVMMTVLTAYPLALQHIHMPGRTAFKVLLVFAMLFSGGLIPTFLTYEALGLYNSFWVLILPRVVPLFSIIIMVNFFRGVPVEMLEAAMLDGASHLRILRDIYLPVSAPAVAIVTLFGALEHWNEWFDGAIYFRLSRDWPLQTHLYNNYLGGSSPSSAAAIFIAALPILLLYPFLQRYFISDLVLTTYK